MKYKYACKHLILSCLYSLILAISYRSIHSTKNRPKLHKLLSTHKDTEMPYKFIPKRFIKFPFDYHEKVSITISDVTNLGSGVGRKILSDGSKWVIHVPFTLPGEEIICQIYQNHKSYSEADLVEVVKASTDRVQPKCEYFGSCGGCQYQHMSIEAQRKWKKEQVEQLLTRIGSFQLQSSTSNNTNKDNIDIYETYLPDNNDETYDNDADVSNISTGELLESSSISKISERIVIPKVNDVIGTSETYSYRSKLTPHYDSPQKQIQSSKSKIQFKQTLSEGAPVDAVEKLLDENDFRIGFQMKSFRRILDIEQCIIALPDVNEQYYKTRQQLKTLFVSHMSSSSSSKEETEKILSSLGMKKIPKNGATLLFRSVDEGVVQDSRQIVTHTIHTLPSTTAASYIPADTSNTQTASTSTSTVTTKTNTTGISYKFKAGEFFQNNLYILPYMIQYVVQNAIGDECDILIDTYCGSGLFALASSKHFKQIWGIEISDQAIEFAKYSAEINNITNTKFVCGSSENIFKVVSQEIPMEKRQNVVVVIDPPRAGCNEIFLKQLFLFFPKKLVYVSCDPSTQARDAKIICNAGYHIQDIQPFDFFPQTRHIENVIVFIRK